MFESALHRCWSLSTRGTRCTAARSRQAIATSSASTERASRSSWRSSGVPHIQQTLLRLYCRGEEGVVLQKHCKIIEIVSIFWTFVRFDLFFSFYNNHLVKDVKENIIKAVEGESQNCVLKIVWLAINVCRGGCRDGGHVDDLHLVRVGQGEPGDLAWSSTWVLDCWSNGEGAGNHQEPHIIDQYRHSYVLLRLRLHIFKQ